MNEITSHVWLLNILSVRVHPFDNRKGRVVQVSLGEREGARRVYDPSARSARPFRTRPSHHEKIPFPSFPPGLRKP